MSSLPIVIFLFWFKSEFLLSNKITRNLSGLTITLLYLNQSMAQLLSNSKMLIRLFRVLTKLDKILSSVKFMNRHITQEKEKIVEENI